MKKTGKVSRQKYLLPTPSSKDITFKGFLIFFMLSGNRYTFTSFRGSFDSKLDDDFLVNFRPIFIKKNSKNEKTRNVSRQICLLRTSSSKGITIKGFLIFFMLSGNRHTFTPFSRSLIASMLGDDFFGQFQVNN